MFNTSSKKNSSQVKNVCSKISFIFIVLFSVACFIPSTMTNAAAHENKPGLTENQKVTFQPYDKPPEIIGGFKELAKHVIYPESAKKERIQGRVVLEIVVDKSGELQKTKVVKSFGNAECDSAAVHAIKNVKWKPAYQNDNPVSASVAVPIAFKLK